MDRGISGYQQKMNESMRPQSDQHYDNGLPSLSIDVNSSPEDIVNFAADVAHISNKRQPPIPTPGRIVHYVLREGNHHGEHRAAMVTSDTGTLVANLHVYCDKTGDLYDSVWQEHFHAASVTYDESRTRPNSWHWPERTIQ